SPRSLMAMAGALGLLFAAALAIAGCQDGYPIAATPCDRLCELTKAAYCESYKPAACVVQCEQTFGGAACYDEFEDYLACVEMYQSNATCTVVGTERNAWNQRCVDAFRKAQECGTAHAPRGPSSSE
ncbi:MAG TPA: hypothetical protein VGC79_28520, partial [Polyangiaceae bacterium]